MEVKVHEAALPAQTTTLKKTAVFDLKLALSGESSLANANLEPPRRKNSEWRTESADTDLTTDGSSLWYRERGDYGKNNARVYGLDTFQAHFM